ncbi:MAG: hypothetical protein HRU03_06010 [Nanoarchaeales archaeon]|nr:hypothetical protein [Nanoarchaeales archaeon]
MNKIKYNFNFSTLYFKQSRYNKEHIAQAIKDYKENVKLTLADSKKYFEIEIRLMDKKTQNIKKLSEEIYNYIENYKIEDFVIKSN